jgi:2-methylcitrate synthase
MTEQPEYSPGLAGVIAGESAISRIDFERNRLILRGYDLVELTDRAVFEEVAWLLLYGDLPTARQLGDFQARLRAERGLPPVVEDLLRKTPAEAHSMAVLRSAVSALGLTDPEARDIGREATLRKAERLLAKIPTILTSAHRCARGLEPVPPDPALGHAANLLHMIDGRPPAEHAVRATDVSLMLYAEHGFNASSFAARVAASTLADLHAAVTAGIAALMGPLHGGANEAAMEMMLEIGEPGRARPWVLEALAEKRLIMGFGHREYKSGDSRVPAMKAEGRRVAAAAGESRWLRIAEAVEETMLSEKGIFPNVDFPVGWTYYTMGLPIPLYTPIFVASRVAGWSAHVIEQQENNRLIRPSHIYTGPEARPFRPLADR